MDKLKVVCDVLDELCNNDVKVELSRTDILQVPDEKGYIAQCHTIESGAQISTVVVIIKMDTNQCRVYVDADSTGDVVPMSLNQFIATAETAVEMCDTMEALDPSMDITMRAQA
jgi:hypothetical protein